MKKKILKFFDVIFNVKVSKAFLDTVIAVIDNSIAAAIAGLSIDLFIPTIGIMGRVELGITIIVLTLTSVLMKL